MRETERRSADTFEENRPFNDDNDKRMIGKIIKNDNCRKNSSDEQSQKMYQDESTGLLVPIVLQEEDLFRVQEARLWRWSLFELFQKRLRLS